MDKDLDVAVVFSRRYIKERNITVLVPQKIVIGKCIQNSRFFINNANNKKIRNMDEANFQNQNYGFYYATSIKKLQEKYETNDYEFVLRKYMDDICKKVHYYTNFDDNKLDSYLLKSISIDEFNKKYSVSFSYKRDNEETNSEKLNSNITTNDRLSQDIINIKKNLNNHICFQDKAIDKLLKTIYDNYIVGTNCNNILISGPSGVGKTAALKILAEHTNHPITYCSIKQEFSDNERDVYDIFADLLSNLYYDAINNKKMSNHSIVILDDFDKLDELEIFEFQSELLKFLQQGKVTITTPKKIIFDANKITFIICGNFANINKNINVPEDFFKQENFKIDNDDIVLEEKGLIDNYMIFEELIPYFQTQVLFNELDLEKTKNIIQSLKNKTLLLYINQLKNQGVQNVIVNETTLDLLANYVYSKELNLKNLDKTITDVFKNIMFDSLNYVNKNCDLYINEKILQKKEKGYQFTLKNKKDMI